MKLRLIKKKYKLLLLCPNGSIAEVNKKLLIRLLTEFTHPNTFKGSFGCWNNASSSMENANGQTLAFVDDQYRLVVLNDSLFSDLADTVDVEYISATEYADLHDKCRASIKNMCAAGRIPGAFKASTGWLIPKNAPYPERKPRTIKAK